MTTMTFVSSVDDKHPWVAIDLGSERRITSVLVAQFSDTAVQGEFQISQSLCF